MKKASLVFAAIALTVVAMGSGGVQNAYEKGGDPMVVGAMVAYEKGGDPMSPVLNVAAYEPGDDPMSPFFA